MGLFEGWFEGQGAKERKSHLSALMFMASADGHLAEAEKAIIVAAAGRMGMSEKEFKSYFDNPGRVKFVPPKDDAEAYEQLVDLVFVMMSDGHIDRRELELICEIAPRLGFHPDTALNMVKDIAAQIASGSAPGNIKSAPARTR